MSRHRTPSIPPFPSEIDRDYFGAWLSGFVDGEAHFALSIGIQPRYRTPMPRGRFQIALRQDDLPVLQLIRSYFQCGWIERREHGGNQNPSCHYRISGTDELETIVVPHFETYRLFAKKRHDFEVWKKGIHLLWLVKHRECRSHRGQRGVVSIWRGDRFDAFKAIADQLKNVRRFNPLPETMVKPNIERTLFDE